MEHANRRPERRTTSTGRGSRLRLTLNRMPSIFMVLDPRCSSASRSDARVASASADCSLGLWDATAAASAAPEPDPPPAGTGGAPSNGAAGAGAGGAGAAGGRSRAVAPFLHRWLHTKHMPAVLAKFMRTNLLLAAGGYCAPDAE